MTHRAFARYLCATCPQLLHLAMELQTPLRFVSGSEAADSAEPDGNQVNAIR